MYDISILAIMLDRKFLLIWLGFLTYKTLWWYSSQYNIVMVLIICRNVYSLCVGLIMLLNQLDHMFFMYPDISVAYCTHTSCSCLCCTVT